LLRATCHAAVEAVFAVAAERKAVSRRYGERRSLIALGDVERIFDDATVLRLAKTAKLPAGADTARFGESIRIAVRIFLREKVRLNPSRLKVEIERLYQLNRRAEGGSDRAAHALARAVVAMPADVRQWLISCNTRHCRNIPTEAELLSPATRQSAVDRLRLVLSYGGGTVAGRKRAGGQRSRSFKALLRAPAKVERGRPRGEAEREFVQWLATSYLEATGQSPPYTAHYSRVIRGPFPRFVHRCFELVGAPSGSVTRLINQFGSARRDIACRCSVRPD
jgi:hypothetical protein